MSYIKAEDVLPMDLIKTIQQYVDGKAIYIPSLQKKAWGSEKNTREILRKRNRQMYEAYLAGKSAKLLAEEHSLSVKTVQKIIRRIKESEEPRET